MERAKEALTKGEGDHISFGYETQRQEQNYLTNMSTNDPGTVKNGGKKTERYQKSTIFGGGTRKYLEPLNTEIDRDLNKSVDLHMKKKRG